MVQILEQIPKKLATMKMVSKSKPQIRGEPGLEGIYFDGQRIPQKLNRELLKKSRVTIKERDLENDISTSQVENMIYLKNMHQNLYLRFADEKPLSLVTDKFKEIDPQNLAVQTAKLTGMQPVVRYFKNNESLQLNFPVESRFEGLNLFVNTGPYGVYGGSGKNAVTYGVAWYNKTCSNWTVFLEKTLNKGMGKITHKNSSNLDTKLTNLLSITDELSGKIEDSRKKWFTGKELDNYLSIYANKGLNKKIGHQILLENPKGISAYDLSYRLTELCQDNKLSDISRAKIEYLAGEVILCYHEIQLGVQKTIDGPSRSSQPRIWTPKQYERLN